MNFKKNHAVLFWVVITLTSIPSLMFGQANSNACLFPELNERRRSDFRTRMERFVEYQVSEQWADLYELSRTSLTKPGRAAFIKEMEAYAASPRRLTGFVPRSSVLVDSQGESKTWLVEGCGSYKSKESVEKRRSSLSATLHHGTWYFDYVTVIVDAVDGNEMPCVDIRQGQAKIYQAAYDLTQTGDSR